MLDHRTTDFLFHLGAARTAGELWARVAAYLDGMGITHSIYTIVDPADPGASRVWTSLPGDWVSRYADEGYYAVDPFYLYCCRTFRPIGTGPDYLADHDFLTDEERRIIVEGGETGFRSGFSSPVRLIGRGAFGGWNFGSGMPRHELEGFLAEHGGSLRLAGFYIHEHAYRLDAAPARQEPGNAVLSPRERECLLWLGRGMRSQEIADRLGIALVTVDLHFRGARRKLDAATREQALAKALLLGLIDP